MDPEDARMLTYSTIYLRLAPPVHKYSSLRSTAHRAAAGLFDGRCATHKVTQCTGNYTSEGSMSSFK